MKGYWKQRNFSHCTPIGGSMIESQTGLWPWIAPPKKPRTPGSAIPICSAGRNAALSNSYLISPSIKKSFQTFSRILILHLSNSGIMLIISSLFLKRRALRLLSWQFRHSRARSPPDSEALQGWSETQHESNNIGKK